MRAATGAAEMEDHPTPTHRHVLVLNHFALPRQAAGGTRHVDLFSRLSGWRATIIAAQRSYFDPGIEKESDDVMCYVWTSSYAGEGVRRVVSWMSYMVTATIAGLRAPSPHAVYASTPHLFAPVAGWVLARRYRVPFVLEVRDLWPQVLADMGRFSRRSPVYRALAVLEGWLYRRANKIVALVGGVTEELRDRGLPDERLHTIPNGVVPRSQPSPAERDEVRRRYELEGFVFAYTGVHGPANGLEAVLTAAKILAVERPGAHFLLVGDGPSKPQLLRRVSELGVDTVRFMDPIPKSEVPALLAAVDCGLHVLADVPLFRYGVSPNKVVDYMAAGLPVITNCPGVVGDLVTAAGAGVAVEPDSIAEGVAAVLDATPEQRASWGADGRAYVEEHRSTVVLAKQLEAVLDAVTV